MARSVLNTKLSLLFPVTDKLSLANIISAYSLTFLIHNVAYRGNLILTLATEYIGLSPTSLLYPIVDG